MPFLCEKEKRFVMKRQDRVLKMIWAAMFLAIAYVLPFFTVF